VDAEAFDQRRASRILIFDTDFKITKPPGNRRLFLLGGFEPLIFAYQR
jgi:hypothetical protein